MVPGLGNSLIAFTRSSESFLVYDVSQEFDHRLAKRAFIAVHRKSVAAKSLEDYTQVL